MTVNYSSFISTVVTMFIILVVGYVLGKMKIIDTSASKTLSRLIIYIGQPAMIISSILCESYSADTLNMALISLGAAFAMHMVMALISYFSCIRIKDIDERKISEFAMVFGNIGFLGIPVMTSLFGANGAFVASFFVVSFNILLWIIGLGIISRKRDDVRFNLRKILINKGTVPSLIGFLIFLAPAIFPSFALPSFATQSISYLASLCTPISMLIIGALLSRRSLKNIFLSGRIYYVCLFKLVLIPLFFCVLLSLFGVDSFWVIFITAISAMPSASSASMFAELYDTAPAFSAQCVGTSTLLSLLTMPMIILLAELICNSNIAIF